MSDQQIGDSVGKSRSGIANSIRLLNFLKDLKSGKVIVQALQEKIITAGHARPLLDLKPDIRLKVFNKIVKNKLSVRMVEKEVNKYKKITIVQFDAHADLRDMYNNEKFSHASAMRRCLDYKNVSLISIGIRNISKTEIDYFKKNSRLQ